MRSVLLSFLDRGGIPQVKRVLDCLRSLEGRMIGGDYSDSYSELRLCESDLESLLSLAKNEGCEELANEVYVSRIYFDSLCRLSKFLCVLESGDYRRSWDSLQDCIVSVKHVSRFLDRGRRLDLGDILRLLEEYESLYPFKLFYSSEYVISKSHCSICGQSMQSLSCCHRRGCLYFGTEATEVVDEVSRLQAICLVSNPEDKKCVLELADDKDDGKYTKLENYLAFGFPPLRHFKIREEKEGFVLVGRNELCPCGSGLKYKKCHGAWAVLRDGKLVVKIGDRVHFHLAG